MRLLSIPYGKGKEFDPNDWEGFDVMYQSPMGKVKVWVGMIGVQLVSPSINSLRER